jgi:hypothetical protein
VTMALGGSPRNHEKELPPSLFSQQCLELDFSHLRAEGVGMLLTHPLKERGSEGTCLLLL